MAGTRRQLTAELIESERKYIHKLNTIINLYMKPLFAKNRVGKPVVPEKHLKILFTDSNITVIRSYNEIFLQELESKRYDCISEVFIKYGDYFKVYISYINNFDKINAFLEHLLVHNAKFRKFCNTILAESGETLSSLMISPVQRLGRYVLFLERLIKCTKSTVGLEEAKQKIEKINHYINDSKRYHESLTLTHLLTTKLVFKKHKVEVMGNGRHYVASGSCKESAFSTKKNGKFKHKLKKPRIVFLFLLNDILIITKILKSYKYKVENVVKLSEINVGKVEDTSMIIRGEYNVYMSWGRESARNMWYDSITKLKRINQTKRKSFEHVYSLANKRI